jgi:hypothetical protein
MYVYTYIFVYTKRAFVGVMNEEFSLLLCSREPATFLYPDPDESNPSHFIILLETLL